MSAPTTEVEAAQPAVAAATQEQTKQEEDTASADAQIKQEESASKTEETAAEPTTDLKMEGAVKTEEADSKPAPLLKTKGKLHKDRSNKKFDPSVLPVTDDPEIIRTQVQLPSCRMLSSITNKMGTQFEFYFGDSNLPSDKHMWTITGGTENKPVKVKHICNFGRCKRFQPYEAVVAALRDSKELEVSGPEGDEEVKRKQPYVATSEAAQNRVSKSVYVKGFGDETPSTQFDIEAFFARYGPVNAIRLRRTDEDFFKGSVFVEFPTEEAAKAFLALDPAPTYQGHELKIMSKRAYMEEKNQLIKEGKLEPQKQHKKFWEGKELGFAKGGRGGRGGGDRRGDSENWNKRRENDQKNGYRGRGDRGGRGGRGGRGRGGRDDRNGRDRRQAAPAQMNTNK